MSQKAVLTEYDIDAPQLKSPIRIALVSDLHERRADDIIELLRTAKPDLTAIAGDTFERYDNDENKPHKTSRFNLPGWILIKTAYNINNFLMLIFNRDNTSDTCFAYDFLQKASKIAPVFMSLGNHEEKLTHEDYETIRRLNIKLLENSDTTFCVNGQEIRIGGMSTFYGENWLKSFADKDGYKLLLCHHPEYFDEFIKDKKINLTLSGHNHGGQVRIFGKGLISSGQGLFPKYDRGVFENRLVVSAGCSNTAALPRWNNPRELVIINLKDKNQ